MMIQQIMLIISLFLFLIGAILTSYQIFKIVELDARARGLNNPELWGLSTAGRGNIIGLILYFKHREDYPLLLRKAPLWHYLPEQLLLHLKDGHQNYFLSDDQKCDELNAQ